VQVRHLLEEHELGERLFERVGEHLQAKGLRLSTGTIVDATISQCSEFDQERAGGAGSGKCTRRATASSGSSG
jgi:IS5 family transposase